MSAGCQIQAETRGCAHSRLPARRTLSCVPLGSVCARTVQPSPKRAGAPPQSFHYIFRKGKKRKKRKNLT